MTSMWPSDKERGQEAAVKHALALANASPDERKAMEAADHAAYVERTRREARTMVQHLTLAQIDRLIAEREAAYNARYSFYSDLTDALRFVRAERFLIDTIKEMRAAMLCPSSPQKVRAARIRCDELLAKLEGK
jgi:hypothetical protein